ncbi:MAG: hypothetical protein WD872_12850 [Pirellulaceae bacterium]
MSGEPIPPDPDAAEQRRVLLWHYELCCERFGEEKGTVLMRKFASNYAQGKHGARVFRTHVGQVKTRAEFFAVVEEHFPPE